MWLVCAAVDTNVDMKALNKYLPCSSGNLRGAGLEDLEKYLGCYKGVVNYFSIVNDTEKKVKVILDKVLLESEWASFHPMDNTGSTAINKDGILKIKELTGRDDSNFEILDFVKLVADHGADTNAGDNAGG
jgi:Ala-tRNA(Pro) deacylase